MNRGRGNGTGPCFLFGGKQAWFAVLALSPILVWWKHGKGRLTQAVESLGGINMGIPERFLWSMVGVIANIVRSCVEGQKRKQREGMQCV